MRKVAEIVGWIVLACVATVLADLIIKELRADARTIEVKSPFEYPPVGAWEKK